MATTSITTTSIGVTIGRHTRLYYAYITTAPANLDAPSTMTLYAATLADVAGVPTKTRSRRIRGWRRVFGSHWRFG
jgi:hypothetical protein